MLKVQRDQENDLTRAEKKAIEHLLLDDIAVVGNAAPAPAFHKKKVA